MRQKQRLRVHDFVEVVWATTSAEAAAERLRQHLLNWFQDMDTRRDFYTGVIEATLPTLTPEHADTLRRIWHGMLARADAQTDAERAAIDEWLEPLSEAPEPEGYRSWLDVLQTCDGGYFTDAVNAELGDLTRIPGFHEAVERLAGTDDRG